MIFGDEDKRLLIQSALAEPEQAILAFNSWLLRDTVYDAPYSASRLFPLIYNNIGSLITDRETADRLRGLARHTWLSNNLRIRLCALALAKLKSDNIPALLLKGAALGAVVTADHSVRQMGDCDILVPYEKAKSAAESLVAAGLHSVPVDVRRFNDLNFKQFHGLTFRKSETDIDVIDLHWRPLREVGCAQLTAEFFESAKPASFAGQDVLAPNAEFIFFHSAMHGSAWDPVGRFDWITDLSVILRAKKDAFDWRLLVSTACKYGCAAMLLRALQYAEKIGGVPLPKSVADDLRAGSNFFDRYEASQRELVAPSSTAGELACTFQRLKRRDGAFLQQPFLNQLKTITREQLLSDDHALQPNGQGLYEADLVYGWHFLEPAGRWTNGKLAYLRLPNDPSLGLRKLLLSFHVLDGYADCLDIFIGFKRVSRVRWPKYGSRWFFKAVDIPASEQKRRWLRVFFRLRRPTSPKKLGTSGDSRTLGILLRDIRILPALRDFARRALDFTNSADEACLWGGWSFAEGGGRWTDGPEATIRWRTASTIRTNAIVRLKLAGFSSISPIGGSIYFDEVRVKDFEFSGPPSGCQLEFSAPTEVPTGQIAELKIEIKKPLSPYELGLSDERRQLGLFVNSLRIFPAPAENPA